ncbi:MAG TPA: putative inorganic carbon transporter subunit DabA, partial [Candidatus Binatia bacterium]|nr:putative inorganic carbon transporter subunit DabA [Candidatus Binatia bacterium]
MAEIIHANFSESQRMELRALIRLASEIIAYYWPMRTFVHHNPLHGLEGLHFEKAAQTAERLLRGKGYLANETFRAY